MNEPCPGYEKPGHTQSIDAFSIDRTEVTLGDYRKCVDAGACTPSTRPFVGDARDLSHLCNWDKPGRDNEPVNCVNWVQASAYCKWAGRRLPTSAEWEKAARGTDGRVYPWGNIWEDGRANVNSGSLEPVGKYPSGASQYGVLDMVGNVFEWVQDRNPDGGRDLRGGSWDVARDFARVSRRNWTNPRYSNADVGFRCAR